ncbi:MAG: PQQ-binding-like beta-propeller repeat protein [Pirellulaceae bacterium]|nr:PQQ-binding-like beta-propeller repeat protein [Pirellulaceae bacterium]
MWRGDARRSAVSSEALPDELALWWVRDYPQLKPAYREPRLQFDAGYEPIVLGKTMYVASSRNDSVTALDVDTGDQRWRFYCDGPVRFAPVAAGDRVYFGSDDGHVYCLNAANGRPVWKFRAAPTARKVLGNGRLISLWPVRGGPVLDGERIYFAAGVWSFEGVFVYCLDAKTGKVIWRNDESGFVYGQHPHGAEAFGGVTPQGYLVVNGDELIVPCGQALPARFELATGKLISFALPKPGRLPGGWFASAEHRAVRRGKVILDRAVNRDLHEDKTYQGPGSAEVRNKITIGETEFRFSDPLMRVKGETHKGQTHSMLAADGKLFVVTTDGRIHCYGAAGRRPAKLHPRTARNERESAADLSPRNREIRRLTLGQNGVAVVGSEDFESLMELLTTTKFQFVVLDSDAQAVDELRRRVDALELYGERVAVHVGSPDSFGLPPYLATLAVLGPPSAQRSFNRFDAAAFNFLRPHGGTAVLEFSAAEHERFAAAAERAAAAGFAIERAGNLTLVRRRGPLAGAVNYTGGWSSPDERVGSPLGVLWFGDAPGHFKRSPQPWFVDGVMISYPKDWMEKHRADRKPPYQLLPPAFSDVYTGRLMGADEPTVARLKFPPRNLADVQPSQYRPPTQRDAWKPKQPTIGERVNPLTGAKEPRAFPKSYGCDGGVDYGHLFTMRSGTPAFYDKRIESGVCNISGPRSGCTNSVIPACGVLNVPYFYEGCTCSYPLPVGLALVSKPPEHEQWSSWGVGGADDIQRVGVNFGAPGDRMTDAGTLWLEHPQRGGPSPQLQVALEPESAEYFYRHSLWLRGGSGWPWVSASGVKGARAVSVNGLKPDRTYTVRLFFAEPDFSEPGRRVFDIAINGRPVRQAFDIAKAAAGGMRSFMIEAADVKCAGSLRIELTPSVGEPLLSGVEIVASGLKLDEVFVAP